MNALRHTLFWCVLAILAGNAPWRVAAEEESYNPNHVAICYHGSEAYVVASPPGWRNDAATAGRFGVCGMYVPEGHSFDDAPAVIYPRIAERLGGDTDEEAVRLQASDSRESLKKVWNGDGPHIEYVKTISAKTGNAVLWHFNEGPPPNEWETVAYLPKGDTVLMLVLSCRDPGDRDRFEASLVAMAEHVVPLVLQTDGKE